MELPETLYYVVHARMPTEKAHGLQVAKMCAAFAAAGQKVILVVPKLGNVTPEEVYAAYGVPATFSIEFIPVFQLPIWVPGAFRLRAFSFARNAARRLRDVENAMVYTRGESILLLTKLLPASLPIIWETHIKPDRSQRYRAAAQRAALLVTVTSYYEKEIPSLWGVPAHKSMCSPDAVELEDFAHPQTKQASRIRLGLPAETFIALYIGRVDGWKGTDILCDAASDLSEGSQVALIGGEPGQVEALKGRYPRVAFLGPRPYGELADNQVAGDVLVLTGNPTSEIAQHYTSPLKLFTYMASNVPIIAFDLPSYRDVLSEETAFFCEPNAQALAEMVEYVRMHPEEASRRAERAAQVVQQYSWHARARTILEHITTAISANP